MKPALWGIALLLASGPAVALQASFGLEYNDNPLQRSSARRGAWGHRFYIVSQKNITGLLPGRTALRQQWGIKRFGRSGADDGEVVASRLDLSGAAAPNDWLGLEWGVGLKLKDANRAVGEEGYRRDSQFIRLRGALGRGFNVGLRVQRSGDVVRESALGNLDQWGVVYEGGYARGRWLHLRFSLAWNRLKYGRRALDLGINQQAVPGLVRQSDRLRRYTVGVQVFRGALADFSVSRSGNRSNSFGYGYRAWNWQASLTRTFPWKIDGHFFLNGQLRTYHEEIANPLPGASGERDEYAQNLVSLRLARPLGSYYGVSFHYRHARNGSRQGDEAYRENSYGCAVELVW